MGGHHHHAGHSHAHGHSHGSKNRKRLGLTLGLTLTYMFAEVVGGLWTGSLALLADAGHMLSDSAALALSLFALWIAARPASQTHTFGYYRAEILAALVNGVALVTIAIFVFLEAWERIQNPSPVLGEGMLLIALGGLILNLIGLWILSSGKDESLNLKGAWLHVLADALGSAGAIVAGLLIWGFGWNLADPVASLFIAVLVLLSSWTLLQASVNVLMEGIPAGMDIDALRQSLLSVEGVCDVHDLHVWTISSGLVSLSAHVLVNVPLPREGLLCQLHDKAEPFGVHHITIQVEPEGFVDSCRAPV